MKMKPGHAAYKKVNNAMNGKCLSSMKENTIKVDLNTKYGQSILIADENLDEQERD